MDDTDIVLDGSVANWIMPTIHGEIGGTYKGNFTFRCYLTPIQELAAFREYAALLGSQAATAPEHEAKMAYTLTQLKYRIVKSPPFWTATLQDGEMAGNIPDLNVILTVFDAAIRSNIVFKARMAKEKDAVLSRTITIAEEMLSEESNNEVE